MQFSQFKTCFHGVLKKHFDVCFYLSALGKVESKDQVSIVRL